MKKIHYLIFGELLIFSLLAYIVYTHPILTIDQVVYNWIKANIMNDTMTKVMKFITFFGSKEGVIGINLLFYLLYKNKKYAGLMTLNLSACLLSYQSIKKIVKRIRPPWKHLVIEKGFSFPSGHTSISFVLYGMMIVSLSHSSYRYKKPLMIFLGGWILLIGFSRIYLGVHFFSDIIGGILLGTIFLQIEGLIIHNLKKKNESK